MKNQGQKVPLGPPSENPWNGTLSFLRGLYKKNYCYFPAAFFLHSFDQYAEVLDDRRTHCSCTLSSTSLLDLCSLSGMASSSFICTAIWKGKVIYHTTMHWPVKNSLNLPYIFDGFKFLNVHCTVRQIKEVKTHTPMQWSAHNSFAWPTSLEWSQAPFQVHTTTRATRQI